jgi:hypothetical protein
VSWRPVSKSKPCLACGHSDWCAWAPDGMTLKCERSAAPTQGFKLVVVKDGGALFRRVGPTSGEAGPRRRGSPARATTSPTTFDFSGAATRFAQALDTKQLDTLARTLGVSVEALRAIGAGWAWTEDLRQLHAGGAGWHGDLPVGAYAFPERDGAANIVGFALRTLDGRKGAPGSIIGSRRGLIVPNTLGTLPGAIAVVEGATDVAAALTLGIAAVGRPSNSAGAADLANLLQGRTVVVLGERDEKPDGRWPGRDGARAVADRLSRQWKTRVDWALPPEGSKDLRDWLNSKMELGLKLDDKTAVAAAAAELHTSLTSGVQAADAEETVPTSELLIQLAQEHYRFGVSDAGEVFAVERDGPNRAIMFSSARSPLSAALARRHRQLHGRPPSASARNDALAVLEGEALENPAEPVYVRVAPHGGKIILDLCDPSGRAVELSAAGWTVLDRSPVLFRKTELTAPLPVPVEGGSLDELRSLLNVSDDTWPLLRGWLIASFFPTLDHAILLLGGEHGTGKSTAARFLATMVDPSPAPLHSPSRDEEQLAMIAAGCWCLCLDNISKIPPWLSDALCRIVTGDAWVRRRLFTDSSLSVLVYRRNVILTSIDAGALRGDLGDRLLLVDLELIDEEKRRSLDELNRVFAEAYPRILGALLTLVSKVLGSLPQVSVARLPRLADFGRILAAVDMAEGTNAFELFMDQRSRIAAEVVDGEPVAEAVLEFIRGRGNWSGTVSELMKLITPCSPPKGWPQQPRALAGHLRRLGPVLRAEGINACPPRPKDKTRTWRLTWAISTAVTPEGAREEKEGEVAGVVCTGLEADRPTHRPSPTPLADDPDWDPGLSGDSGGQIQDPNSTAKVVEMNPKLLKKKGAPLGL